MRLLGQLTALLLALCAFITPRSAAADPASELEKARAEFRSGNFNEVIPILSALLYPKSQLAKASDLSEAHMLLGVSYFETDNKDAAAFEFEEALYLDPGLTLEPDFFSTDVVQAFNNKKSELKKKKEEDEEKKRLARENEAFRRALDNMVVIERREYYVNYIPFGAGQFQNGQQRKGVFFLTSQAVTGGISLGLFLYQALRYGFPGEVPRDEVDTVRKAQFVQLASGYAFVGLAAWGIADSLLNYKPSIERKPDKRYLLDTMTNRKETSMRLQPFLGPQAGGLLLQGSF